MPSFDIEYLLWALLLIPLGAAAVSAVCFRKSRWGAPVVSCLAAAGIVAAAAGVLTHFAADNAPVHVSWQWLSMGSYTVNMGFLVDANTATLLFVVAFTAFWIHIFSVGYMSDDKARGRFFAGLSVFMFSMLGIVLADNLYMLFAFWELVGFSSYMLIAHYFERPDAVAASKKAFIVNRVGDLGFLLGIVLCHAIYGTVDLTALPAAVGDNKNVLVGALLLCGFIGKSAQFPLHVWLADAMAGPTPVSALIHAATMVAAGVYLMVRVFFMLPAAVLTGVLWGCAVMAVLAAFCALAQTDIKKSLAYSTLSHLGLMGVAIGLGLPEIALLHLTTHAFFKATLFLCAGSVIHACHHEQDMLRMGGLARRMKLTHAAFVLAGLSACAFPFSAGWVSKDTILTAALVQGRYAVFALLAAAALGSVLYMGRIWMLVFAKRKTADDAANELPAAHARESSVWMLLPLAVLGIFAFFAGTANFALLPAEVSLAFAPKYHALHEQLGGGLFAALFGGNLALLAGGAALAFLLYRQTDDDALRTRFPRLYRALEYRWFDALYDGFVARVVQPVANSISFLDTLLVNGLVVRCIGGGLPGLLGIFARRLFHGGSLWQILFWFVIGALLYGAVMLHHLLIR